MSRRSGRFPLGLALAIGAAGALGPACQPGGADHGEPARGDCVTCHRPEHASAEHHAGARPVRCEVCHASTSWQPTALEHRWPLTGAHLALAKDGCFKCHGGDPPVFEGTSEACVGCHRAQYDNNPLPWHARFPTTCADCHTTTAWKPALPHGEPAVTAAPIATAAPTVTAAPSTKPTARPVPKPTPTGKPVPKPIPTVKPVPKPTVTPPPDIGVGPSSRR